MDERVSGLLQMPALLFLDGNEDIEFINGMDIQFHESILIKSGCSMAMSGLDRSPCSNHQAKLSPIMQSPDINLGANMMNRRKIESLQHLNFHMAMK
eukprot:CAMPEP_0170563146 /NCGR_PEP_ID=MMETSP0211-20121228/64600_1 /TAXON_ID=311385 /ORGANISM="Pseudokeronopsis sp., Strain OXSARD2" /LENGTH=96 /DNA_ID=CAMNT_0010880969 /DNA_START=298 /DNA_END=588 /DNA_ORIENTATION=-